MSATLDDIMSSEKAKRIDRASNFLSSALAELGEAAIITYPDLDSALASGVLQMFLLDNRVPFRVSFSPKVDAEEFRDESACIITVGLKLPRREFKEFEKLGIKILAFCQGREDRAGAPGDSSFEVYVDSSRSTLSSAVLSVLREIWVPMPEAYIAPILAGIAYRLDRTREGTFTSVEREMVAEAVSRRVISELLGLKLSHFESKPVSRSLHDTLTPYLKGITGDESGTEGFLRSIGISGGSDVRITDLPEDTMSRLVKELMKRAGSPDRVTVGWIVGKVYRLAGSTSRLRDLRDVTSLLSILLDTEGALKVSTAPMMLNYYISSYSSTLESAPSMLRKHFRAFNEASEEVKVGKFKVIVSPLRTVGGAPLALLEEALEDHGMVRSSDIIAYNSGGKMYVRLERIKQLHLPPEEEWKVYELAAGLDPSRGYIVFDDIGVIGEVKK